MYFVTETDSQLVDFGLLFTQGHTSVAIEDASGNSKNINDLEDLYRTVIEHFIRTIQGDTGVTPDTPPQQEAPADDEEAPAVMAPSQEELVENPEEDAEEEPTGATSWRAQHGISESGIGKTCPLNANESCILYKVERNHIKILHVGHAVLDTYRGAGAGFNTLFIPLCINGLPVTEIAPYAFYGTNYAEVCLPDTLKSVPPYTFYPYGRNHVIHIGENTTVYPRSV